MELASTVTPLLRASDDDAGHLGSKDSLNEDEPQPKPKQAVATPSLQRQMPSESNGRQTGMVVMPDGSVIPVASGTTSQQRSDVSSVERPNTATPYASSVATASPMVDSEQEKPLPMKPTGLSGPAPGSNMEPLTNYPPPHVHATPSPFASMPPYHTGQYAYAGEAIPPKPGQLSGGGAGPAPHGGGQHHGYIHPSYSVPPSMQQPSVQQPSLPPKGGASQAPVPGRAPDHVPSKPGVPIAGPAPDTAHHRGQLSPPPSIPAVQSQPNTYQRLPSYQPYPLHQYQPYQPPLTGQFTTPYTTYQQPAPTQPAAIPQVQKKPVKTTKEFDTNTLSDNQYYISICLCITLTLLCNPCILICCIPAFMYASKAADENKKDNYEEALSLHKKAQWFNAGGFISIIVGGTFFLIFISIVAGVGSAVASASSSTNNY